MSSSAEGQFLIINVLQPLVVCALIYTDKSFSILRAKRGVTSFSSPGLAWDCL